MVKIVNQGEIFSMKIKKNTFYFNFEFTITSGTAFEVKYFVRNHQQADTQNFSSFLRMKTII